MGILLVCLVLSQTPPPATTTLTPDEIQDIKDVAAAKATEAANAANAEANKEIIANNKVMAEKLRVSGWKIVKRGSKLKPILYKRMALVVRNHGEEEELDCISEQSGGAWACFMDTWSGCMMVVTPEKMVITHGCKSLGSSSSTVYRNRTQILRDLHKIVGGIKK